MDVCFGDDGLLATILSFEIGARQAKGQRSQSTRGKISVVPVGLPSRFKELGMELISRLFDSSRRGIHRGGGEPLLFKVLGHSFVASEMMLISGGKAVSRRFHRGLRVWWFAGLRLIEVFFSCCSREDRYADGVAVYSFMEKRY